MQRRLRQLILAACAAVLMVGSAQAQTKAQAAFICQMDFVSRDNFIMPEFAFWIDRAGNVTVLDGAIKHYMGGPIKARVTEKTDSRLSFRWKIKGIMSSKPGGAGKVSMAPTQYSATYRKKSGLITMKATVSGYDNSPSGRGSCSPIKR